jgi:hypothetical protein
MGKKVSPLPAYQGGAGFIGGNRGATAPRLTRKNSGRSRSAARPVVVIQLPCATRRSTSAAPALPYDGDLPSPQGACPRPRRDPLAGNILRGASTRTEPPPHLLILSAIVFSDHPLSSDCWNGPPAGCAQHHLLRRVGPFMSPSEACHFVVRGRLLPIFDSRRLTTSRAPLR